MHYRIDNEAGTFAVCVAVHNGVDSSRVAFEAWRFTVIGTAKDSAAVRALMIRDAVAGSAERREDIAVRAAGLCLAAAPNAAEALVCFRDDSTSYQGMVTIGASGPRIDIPMTDRDIYTLLQSGTPSATVEVPVLPQVRKEAAWTRPSNRSFSSRTSRISFE